MTVYAIAQFRIHDRERYDRYQAKFRDVFVRHQGRALAADEAPQVLEGDNPVHKVVLLEFPDEAAFRAWSDSPEYREISKDREAATDGSVTLIKGFN